MLASPVLIFYHPCANAAKMSNFADFRSCHNVRHLALDITVPNQNFDIFACQAVKVQLGVFAFSVTSFTSN